jgi:hypothetical protein
MLVSKQLTPSNEAAVTVALIKAWEDARNESPSLDILALLLAQSALETGHWKSMYNWNLYNGIAVSSAQLHYNGLDSGNSRQFRAFESLGEGADRYVQQMLSPTRPNWRDGLLTGDPEKFNVGLSTPPRFYEADPKKYGEALTKLWVQFGGNDSSQEESLLSDTARRKGGLTAGLIVAGALGIITYMRKIR